LDDGTTARSTYIVYLDDMPPQVSEHLYERVTKGPGVSGIWRRGPMLDSPRTTLTITRRMCGLHIRYKNGMTMIADGRNREAFFVYPRSRDRMYTYHREGERMLVEIRTRTGVPCERSRWEVAPDGQTLHRSVESAIDGHYTLVYEEVFDKADSENLIPSIAPSPP